MSNELPKKLPMFNRLDQRVVPHGKPLYLLLQKVALDLPKSPTTITELDELVAVEFGRWSPPNSATSRNQPQNVLAMEHFRLIDEIFDAEGEDAAKAQSLELLDTVLKLVAKYKELDLVVWRGEITPVGQIVPASAYKALNERCMAAGFQVHDEIKAWTLGQQPAFAQRTNPTQDVGYMQLAQQFSRSQLPQKTRFQSLFDKFIGDISVASGESHAVVIQSVLANSFARAIRRYVKELNLEGHLSTPELPFGPNAAN